MENYPSLFSNTLRISHYYQVINVYICEACMSKTEVLSGHIRAALKPINDLTTVTHSISIDDLIARYMKVFSKSREEIIDKHLPYLPQTFIERIAKPGYLCKDCFTKKHSHLGVVDHGETAPLPNNIEIPAGEVYSENVPDPKPISKKAQKLSKKIRNAEKNSKLQAQTQADIKAQKIIIDKKILYGPIDVLF